MDKVLAYRAGELELERSQNPYLKKKSQVQQHVPAIPALGKSRQVDPRSFGPASVAESVKPRFSDLKNNQRAGEMSQSQEDPLLLQRPGLDPQHPQGSSRYL